MSEEKLHCSQVHGPTVNQCRLRTSQSMSPSYVAASGSHILPRPVRSMRPIIRQFENTGASKDVAISIRGSERGTAQASVALVRSRPPLLPCSATACGRGDRFHELSATTSRCRCSSRNVRPPGKGSSCLTPRRASDAYPAYIRDCFGTSHLGASPRLPLITARDLAKYPKCCA
jgi:hypothetical protein